MDKKSKTEEQKELKLVLQELEENPYKRFEMAFALMSIIPFLAFFYLLVARLFTVSVLIGDIGLVLFISITLSLCGFYLGHNEIKRSLRKVVYYAAKAKHSDQLKSKFVATVSHDLRNPLFVLDANISDLTGGLFGQVNENQLNILKVCGEVVDRMESLVSNLLDIYKIEAGMIELKKAPCDLSRMLETQLAEFEVMLSKKRVKLEKELQGENLSIKGDEEKITQVVNNLLGNAVKFTPEDGTIGVKLFPVEGFMRLEVTDNGESIPPDKLKKIFDKFERLDTKKKGSGLGLAIAKDIVELHNGKIWAESESGKGNTFIVVLPRK